MQRLCWILIVGFALVPKTSVADEPKPSGRLLFLGIAYDEAPGPGLSVNDFDYAPDNFVRLFQEQSRELFREIKVETIKGNAVTRDALGARLRALKSKAERNDLVFVYWGTHGGTDKKGWGANVVGGQVVYGTEIKAELAQVKCPAVVVISTCGSGGFVRPTPQQVELPSNMAAFCACRRRQSTSNELDIALAEGLAGFGDLNHDGQITLKEMFNYVPRRYRKLMKDAEGEDVIPVLGHAEGLSLDLPLTKTSPAHVAVAHDGVWYGGQLLEKKGEKSKVRFLGWDSINKKGPYSLLDRFVPEEAVDLPGGFPPVEVEADGVWYPATILSRKGSDLEIHYVGYPDSDNEVVPPKRVRYPFVLGEADQGSKGGDRDSTGNGKKNRKKKA